MSRYPLEQTKDGSVLSGEELHHYWLEDIRKLFWLMLNKFGSIDNVPYWQTGRAYAVGTVIWYKKDQYYQCIQAISNATSEHRPPNTAYWISVDPTNNPELMPWCAGKWEDVMFINPSTGLGAPAVNDPRKFNCTQDNYPYGYDPEEYSDFFGNGDKPYWYPGQNSGTGKSTTPCDFTVNPMQAVPGYTGGIYNIPGPCVWYNGDWASPYSVTAQTETTITVTYNSNRDTDFQVGMPIRLTGTTSVDPENPGTNDGVYRIKSFVVEGSNVVITLADQDDEDTTIRTDLPLGEINCDFGGDYYSCGGYWYWGDPEAVGPFVNSRKAIPPRGGQWSASKIVYSHRGVESGWVRAFIPNKYHKWDENGERYFCDTPIIDGSYAITDSRPSRDARYVGVVVPLKNLLPRQTDPKEQVPPVKYTDSGRISWRYGDKVEIRRSIFTDVGSLRPDYGSVERVEVDIRSSNNYGRCFAGNYTQHDRYSVGGGTGHIWDRWLPYLGAEWKVFKAEGTSTGSVSTSAPEELRHKSINEDRSYQNMLMWLVSHLEERIMIEVDDLFKLNFINWINAVNGTSYTVEHYDITDSRFPAVAPSNHSCWGCNGSGFELLLKKIGSYDWYFDPNVPWNPVELLDYRIARNTERYRFDEFDIHTIPPHWRPATSLIRQWEATPAGGHVQGYDEGVIVSYGGNYYRANATHTNTSTFQASNWTQISNPYNNPDFRLIGEDDWYMPKNKGSWRRTWKYSLGRIPGVVYWPHDRKGVPAGDTQYSAGPASGGGTTTAYPAGQTINGVTYPWPFHYPNEDDTWARYSSGVKYSNGPYGMAALYPFPYADVGNVSSFNAGIKNPTTNLFGPYDQEHLDAIRESVANYRAIEVLITTDEFEVTESIYNVLKVGWRIHLHKLNDPAEHAEVLVIRKRTSGSSYYIKVHDLRETPAQPLSYFNRCYFDSDICARHDADWVSIVDGELVEGFSIKPEMIEDMREMFNHMDQVEYPCTIEMHINNNTIGDPFFGGGPNYAHFVFDKPEQLGATGYGPYAEDPYILYSESEFKNYLKQVEAKIIETRLSHELPLLSGELTIPEWQPGTYNTGQKVKRYGLIATARRDGVTSDPWNEYYEWFINPTDTSLRDWSWVYTPGEWYDPGPYPSDTYYPKVFWLSRVDANGVVDTSGPGREIRVHLLDRYIHFRRLIRWWTVWTEDYAQILSAHWYYFMYGGFQRWGFAAVHFDNMPSKFDGLTIKVNVYACCYGYNQRPAWEQDDPITYPPIAETHLRGVTLSCEDNETDLGEPHILPTPINSQFWYFHEYVQDPVSGQYTFWLKPGYVKKIPIRLTSQDGKAYIPFFIKPRYDYDTTEPGSDWGYDIKSEYDSWVGDNVRPSSYHDAINPLTFPQEIASYGDVALHHNLSQHVLIAVDSTIAPIISPDLFNVDFDQFERDLVRCIIEPYDPKTDAIPPQPNPSFLLIAAIHDANVHERYYWVRDEWADNNLYIKGVAGRAEDYEGNTVYYEWRLVEADGTVFKTFTDTNTNSKFSSYDTLWDELNASTITQLNELYLQVRTKDSAGNEGEWSEPKQITANTIVPLKGAFTVEPSFTGEDLISCTAKVTYGMGPTEYQIGYENPISGKVETLTDWQSSNVFTNVEYTSRRARIAVRAQSNGVIGNWGLSSSTI